MFNKKRKKVLKTNFNESVFYKHGSIKEYLKKHVKKMFNNKKCL